MQEPFWLTGKGGEKYNNNMDKAFVGCDRV